jgi:osmoprotectant transport system substrate-binding protein
MRLFLRACLSAWVLGLAIAVGSARAQPADQASYSLRVGGKGFTEQLLVAEMTRLLLEAKGYNVVTKTGLATTGIRREQVLGLVDLYWEYTGTALVTFHNITEKLTPEDAYTRIKDLDAKLGIVWLEPSRVNNTYALAMRGADARREGISTISELAEKMRGSKQYRFATSTEFYFRPDGLMPLERTYGFEFGPENVKRMESGRIYQLLRDSSDIDVGLVFSTDGRIAAYELQILIDDRGFFPSYHLTPVVRQSAIDRFPLLSMELNALSEKLDDNQMARLNGMVDIQKMSVRDVSSLFLRMSGLL